MLSWGTPCSALVAPRAGRRRRLDSRLAGTCPELGEFCWARALILGACLCTVLHPQSNVLLQGRLQPFEARVSR